MKLKQRILFSAREIRALSCLFPVIAVTVWILCSVSRCSDDKSAEIYADKVLEGVSVADNVADEDDSELQAVPLHDFDPNTVTYLQLREMGVEKNAALSLIRYRSNGKIFRIKEDVAGTYNINDSIYFALEPYIVIDKQFKPARQIDNDYTASRVSTTAGKNIRRDSLFIFDPNLATVEQYVAMGFSQRQGQAIVNYVDSRGLIESVDEFGECYIIDDDMLERLRPFIVIAQQSVRSESVALPLELNGADTAALVSVSGIGSVTARAIAEYRSRLGGFHDVDQLKELKVITERNFEKIIQQIWVDSCKIQKIDINFATPRELEGHPYMTPQRIRKILKNRQLKGGWTSIEEMIEDKTFTDAEAVRIAPYLQFSPSEDSLIK